jgi:tRNA G18 (ribose-2'-O)-methylase SpoU
MADLKEIGFTLVGLTPDPTAIPIGAVSPASRVALLLGAEAEGLSETALAATDVQVRIPQTGALDSLNVGHAAAIAFHHFGRR